MSERASAYIASSYQMLRGMFCSFLSGKCDMTVLGEAADGETACREILRLQPQLVLLDIDLPELSGLEVTGRVMAELPQTLMIAITEKPESAWLVEFLSLGGRGYITDCRSEADLLRAVLKVMAGKLHLEDAGVQLLAQEVCRGRLVHNRTAQGGDVSPQTLSERERQILHLAARGYSGTDMAAILLISASTVGTHIRRIREKLRLEQKADMVAYAVRYNLYDDWK